MAADTSPIRRKTRRAKDLALDKAILVLENPDKYADIYKDTYLTVLKNSVPRTQEITGEDGKDLIPLPILNNINVHSNLSNNESSKLKEAIALHTGRDISEQDNINPALPDSLKPDGHETDTDLDS